jgi:hypothetical protein
VFGEGHEGSQGQNIALGLKAAAAGSRPGRCHETPLRRLANFEVDRACTAPIRGSCSRRYFDIFFFFFFIVAMAYFLFVWILRQG